MSKYRQIVDEHDVYVCNKWGEDVDFNTDIYRVSALWLTNSKGQILLARRSPAKPNGGGQWGPAVAGTVEYKETYKDNIVKETHEEIGLEGLVIKQGPKIYLEAGGRRYFAQYFYANIDKHAGDFTLEQNVAEVKWVDQAWLIEQTHNHPDLFVAGFDQALSEILRSAAV